MPPSQHTRMLGSAGSAPTAGGKQRWPRYAMWISPVCFNLRPTLPTSTKELTVEGAHFMRPSIRSRAVRCRHDDAELPELDLKGGFEESRPHFSMERPNNGLKTRHCARFIQGGAGRPTQGPE